MGKPPRENIKLVRVPPKIETPKRASKTRLLVVTFLALFVAPLYTYLLPRITHGLFTPDGACPSQPSTLTLGPDWDTTKDQEMLIERLKGAVRLPTQSYDDMGNPPDDDRFSPFGPFTDYLKNTFPAIHKHLTLETVNTYGKLYTWKGSNPHLKPIVLMAHQDVVPVNEETMRDWTHPPFDAFQDENGWIWGRGTTDCKNTLIGSMSALEKLILEGFQPLRTIHLSFGFDEEITGARSARGLAKLILSKYGRHGVGLIVDEGFAGVGTHFGKTFVRFGLAEKGAVNLVLTVHSEGGHSSVPPEHTGIGVLSRLITHLENNPSPLRLKGNPMLDFLHCIADYGSLPSTFRALLALKQYQRITNYFTVGKGFMKRAARAFLGTTQAVDEIEGGVKLNALPEISRARINYRIDFQSSVKDHFRYIISLLTPVTQELGYTLRANGSVYSEPPESSAGIVDLDLSLESAIESAPLTPSYGGAWDLMGGTAKRQWKDAIAAPFAMIANSDTKHYWDVSRHIYRFVPAEADQMLNYHTVNERIHVDAHLQTVRFYYNLLQNAQQWHIDDPETDLHQGLHPGLQ